MSAKRRWEQCVMQRKFEDVGGETMMGVNVINVTVTNAASIVAPNNIRRKALILSTNATVGVSFSFSNNLSAGHGIFIPSNGVPLVLTDEQIGDAVTMDLYAISSGANVTIDIQEIVYKK